jgi:hypothetical protein
MWIAHNRLLIDPVNLKRIISKNLLVFSRFVKLPHNTKLVIYFSTVRHIYWLYTFSLKKSIFKLPYHQIIYGSHHSKCISFLLSAFQQTKSYQFHKVSFANQD